MNLQPSKLSVAANQVWKESSSLFKKDNVKIDLGLDKTIKRENTSSSDSKNAFCYRHVFGSKLSERVVKPESETTAEKDNLENADKPTDISSIFKKVVEKNSNENMWKSSKNSDGLEASVAELTKKTQQETELNSSEPVTTGEEDEINLINVSCKFFEYNPESKAWVERGMGFLKVNQKKDSIENIRLVGRTSGSQRVIINTKIFPHMILETLSEKRLKISAQNSSDKPQLFIIQASQLSIANLKVLLEKEINRTKNRGTTFEVRKRRQNNLENSDNDETGPDSSKKFIKDTNVKENS